MLVARSKSDPSSWSEDYIDNPQRLHFAGMTGYTKVLQAKGTVQANKNAVLNVTVKDDGDGIFDTAVFLEGDILMAYIVMARMMEEAYLTLLCSSKAAHSHMSMHVSTCMPICMSAQACQHTCLSTQATHFRSKLPFKLRWLRGQRLSRPVHSLPAWRTHS